MTRAIATITCLIATLFLVFIQGECCEIPEYQSETEIEYCAVACSLYQSQVTEHQPGLLPVSDLVKRRVFIYVKMREHVLHVSARILNCVLRE